MIGKGNRSKCHGEGKILADGWTGPRLYKRSLQTEKVDKKSWAKMKEQCLCGIFRQKTENQSLNMKFADKEAKLGIKSLGRKKKKKFI